MGDGRLPIRRCFSSAYLHPATSLVACLGGAETYLQGLPIRLVRSDAQDNDSCTSVPE